MKIVVYYAPELEPGSETDLRKHFELGEYFYLTMSYLEVVLPVGSIIKFPDATINVPEVENNTGDVWFKVVLIEYTTEHPDTIFLRLELENGFDIDNEEIVKFLRSKWKNNPTQ